MDCPVNLRNCFALKFCDLLKGRMSAGRWRAGWPKSRLLCIYKVNSLTSLSYLFGFQAFCRFRKVEIVHARFYTCRKVMLRW